MHGHINFARCKYSACAYKGQTLACNDLLCMGSLSTIVYAAGKFADLAIFSDARSTLN